MIDDATSRTVARFVDHDSTAENLRLLGRYVEVHGRPLAVYTDKASLFQTTPKGGHQRAAPGEAADADRAGAGRTGHRVDRGPLPPKPKGGWNDSSASRKTGW